MLYILFLKIHADLFGSLDRDGTYQYRLSLLMSLDDGIDDSLDLLLMSTIYGILIVYSYYRLVRRYGNYIHAVYLTEFLILRDGGTGHTALLLILVEVILKSDSSQSLGLPVDLYMLFCFYRLMETVGITSARKDTSRKVIYYQYFVIFYYIVLILEHKVMSL